MHIVYDDGLVACTDRELIIRRYYFPWGSAKRIPYSAIRGARWIPLNFWTGSCSVSIGASVPPVTIISRWA